MIRFDAASENGTPGNSTWAHTCSGSARFLIVGVVSEHTGSGVTGATYNGVAMTGLYSVEGTIYFYTLYLANPAPGTHNIVVSGGDGISCVAASYMGTDVTDPTEDPPYTHSGYPQNYTPTPSGPGHWAFNIIAGVSLSIITGTQRVINTDNYYAIAIGDTAGVLSLTLNWDCAYDEASINVVAVINPTSSGVPAALSPYFVF